MTREGEVSHSRRAGSSPGPEKQSATPPNSPLSLRLNALWATVGTAAYALAQWVQIAMIAHFGTATDVGQYSLAMAICAPVFLFFNLQLRPIQATDAHRSYSFPEYLALRLLSSSAAFAVVAACACFRSRSAALITLAVGLFKGFESVSDIYQGLLQQHERMDAVGRSLLLKSTLILMGFGIAYYGTHNLLLAASVSVSTQLAGLLLYDMRAAHLASSGRPYAGWRAAFRGVGRPQFERTRLLQLTRHALPLGFSVMLGSLYSNLPRFVLNKYVGVRGVGIFSAIGYLPMIGSLLVTALGTAAAPRLSQYARANRSGYFILLGKLLLFAAILGLSGLVGSMLLGQRILRLLYGAEYARQTAVLSWTMLAASLNYLTSCLGFGVTALGRFKAQPWIMAVAIVVFFAFASVLVPEYGLTGAAIASAASTLASLFGYLVLLFRKDARDS
jgi:O-antigen/teichoic acid export membrane protein